MLSETLQMALTVIARNKGRSALTIVGLTIGVAAFIAVVSFGLGARTAVLAQFEGLGVNVLRVRMRSVSRQSGRPGQLLTDRDVAMLRSESSAISLVVPSTFRTGIFGHAGARMRGSLIATEPEYALLQRLVFVSGGMFDALDNSTAARVCVLGAGTASRLFDDGDPVGQSLTIGAHFVCRVVGVVSRRVGATSGSEVNEFVLVPARTFQENIERTGYSYFDLRPIQPELHEVARAEAESIMRRAHQYAADDARAEVDFDVVSPDDISRAADRTAVLLTGLLAAVAGVSLLVGGIGIMNLQLVAVSERAQEIGIRAAIGAAPQQIVRQFLMESSVLSGLGALIGVALGGIASRLVAHSMHWSFGTPAWVSVGAGVFGVLVGIAFGYVPAQRAARLDPIEALRQE